MSILVRGFAIIALVFGIVPISLPALEQESEPDQADVTIAVVRMVLQLD